MKIIIEKIKPGLKPPSHALLHPEWWLRSQYSHPIVPMNVWAVILRERAHSSLPKAGHEFSNPSCHHLSETKVLLPWAAEMAPLWMAAKARAISGWTSHSNSCSTALLGSPAGWLWELIPRRSHRGSRPSFLYALRKPLYGGRTNKQN